MTGPRQLLLPLTAAHALNHAYLLALPVILGPLMAEFHTGPLGGGTALMGLYLAAGLGALPAGWLADRFGSRRVIAIFLVGAAACLGFTAMARNLVSLSVAIFFLGAFCSLYHPAGLAAISRECRPIGRAMGIHGMGGNLGLAMGPLLVAGLTSVIGWRPALGILAASGIHLLTGIERRKRITADRPEPATAPPDRSSLASRTGFLLSVTAIALAGLCYRGILTFLPLHLARNSGGILSSLDPVGAGGLLTTFCLLIGMGGQYFGGRIGHLAFADRIYGILLLGAVPFPFLMGYLNGLPLVLAAAAFAFFFFAAQPLGNLLVARHSGESRRSLGYGISFSLNFGIGSLAAPASGWIAQEAGLAAAFPAMGIPLAGAILFSWILSRTVTGGKTGRRESLPGFPDRPSRTAAPLDDR